MAYTAVDVSGRSQRTDSKFTRGMGRGYKRSTSASPEDCSNNYNLSDKYTYHEDLNSASSETSRVKKSEDVVPAPPRGCYHGSSLVSIDRPAETYINGDKSNMWDTSIVGRNRRQTHRSSDLVASIAPEENLPEQNSKEIAIAASSPVSGAPHADKAVIRVSASVAPPTPVLNSEKEGVATSCKRLKPSNVNLRERQHTVPPISHSHTGPVSAERPGDGPKAATLDHAQVNLVADGEAREQTTLSGQGDAAGKAPGWGALARYKGQSSSNPKYEYRPSLNHDLSPEGLLTKHARRLPTDAIRISIDRNMGAGERRSAALNGTFRPQNKFKRNNSSSPSLNQMSQSKVFNLQDGEFNSRSDERHIAKRQKFSPEEFPQSDLPSNIVNLSDTWNQLGPRQSVSSKGSPPQNSVQSLSSRSQKSQKSPFSMKEYRLVEATVGFDTSYKLSKSPNSEIKRKNSLLGGEKIANLKRKTPAPSIAKQQTKDTRDRQIAITREESDVDEIEEVSPEPKRHQSSRSGPVPRPRTTIDVLDKMIAMQPASTETEASPHFATYGQRVTMNARPSHVKESVGSPGDDIQVVIPATRRHPSTSRRVVDVVDDSQYLDDDSVDLVRAGDDDSTQTDIEVGLQQQSNKNFSRALAVPVLRSISTQGDIPRSAIARNQPEALREKIQKASENTFSLYVAYMQAGAEVWTLEGHCEPWQFQYLDEKKEFNLVAYGDPQDEKRPGLILKPPKTHKIYYNDDSAKVVVLRSMESNIPSFSTKLLIKGQTFEDSTNLVRWLKRLNPTIQFLLTSNEKLDKMFEAEIKTHKNRKTPDTRDHKFEETELLEANESRRAFGSKISQRSGVNNQAQPANVGRRRDSTMEVSVLESNSRQMSMVERMTAKSSAEGQASTRELEDSWLDLEHTGIRRNTRMSDPLTELRSVTRASIGRQSSGRELRPPKSRSPSPMRWTAENPRWKYEKGWKASLQFPAEGEKRATVDAGDIGRLDEGEFLNDNLIGFYLRYLEDQLEKSNPQLARRIYFQNTYFYVALTQGEVRSNNINYDAVKRWTRKVDLFSYDYIIVPVNERLHWYVAIICNAPRLLHGDIEEGQGSQGMDQLSPTEPAPPPTTSLNEDSDGDCSITVNLSGRLYDAAAHMQPETSPGKDSATRSVTTQVEHMSLDEYDNEWPEPDAVPEPSEPGHSRLRVLGAASNHTEELVVRDITEKMDQSSDMPPKAKKLKRKSLPPPRKYNPRDPRIITLDSLGGAHSPTCSKLREYLVCEAKERRDVRITASRLGMTAKGLPQQSNFSDCGIFVLGYVEKFLKNPDAFIHSILQGEVGEISDWPETNAPRKRTQIRDLIFQLHAEQVQKETEQLRLKSQTKKISKAGGESAASKTPTPRGLMSTKSILSKATVLANSNTDVHDSSSKRSHNEQETKTVNKKEGQPSRPQTPHTALASSPIFHDQTSSALGEERSSTDRRKALGARNTTKKAVTGVNESHEIEIMESPTSDFELNNVSQKTKPNSPATSPFRSSDRLQKSHIELDNPKDSVKRHINQIKPLSHKTDDKLGTSNVFQRFAKGSKSPSLKSHPKTQKWGSTRHTPVEVDAYEDDSRLEVRETPTRELEREDSFEDLSILPGEDLQSTRMGRGREISVPLLTSSPITPPRAIPQVSKFSPRTSDRKSTSIYSPNYNREARRK